MLLWLFCSIYPSIEWENCTRFCITKKQLKILASRDEMKTLESMRKYRFWDEQLRFGGVDFTEKNIFWENKMLLCQWRKSGLESYNSISLLWAKATCKRGFLACLKELVTNWKTNVPFWKTTYKLMFYDHNSI